MVQSDVQLQPFGVRARATVAALTGVSRGSFVYVLLALYTDALLLQVDGIPHRPATSLETVLYIACAGRPSITGVLAGRFEAIGSLIRPMRCFARVGQSILQKCGLLKHCHVSLLICCLLACFLAAICWTMGVVHSFSVEYRCDRSQCTAAQHCMLHVQQRILAAVMYQTVPP